MPTIKEGDGVRWLILLVLVVMLIMGIVFYGEYKHEQKMDYCREASTLEYYVGGCDE